MANIRPRRAWPAVVPVLLVGVPLLLLPATAAAQGSALAGVRGVVTDSAGEALRAVRIELQHVPTGRSAVLLTDADGRFVFTNHAPGGPYTLSAATFGFAPQRVEGIELLAGSIRRIDVELRASAVALDAVEVRVAADPRFGAERTGAATVLDRAAVEAQPTITRDVMALSALAPMAVATDDGFTIAGQNARYNTFTIDGGRYQDVFGLSVDGSPGGRAHARPLPLHAVEQFQVLVAPFDVRQSGFTGGLLNVVTRSGTNTWEAAGFGHYRDEHFIGELDSDGGGGRPARFENSVAGVTIGGPLRRDRAHILVALEVERRTAPSSGFSIGSADPLATRVAPDSAARFVDILDRGYGYDVGAPGTVSLDNPRENVFVRADWRLGGRHRLMLRHNHTAARRDIEPNRSATGTYEFGSQRYRFASRAHVSTLQLISSSGGRWSNDLLINVQRMSDRTTPASTLPIVEVDVTSSIDTLRVTRSLRAGGHFEAQSNAVTQSGIEVRSASTAAFGAHLVTLGIAGEVLGFRSRYLANPHGVYRYASLAALEANQASHFERTLLTGAGADNAANFRVSQWSAFAQSEWNVSPQLTLSAGVRADVPIVHGRPARNAALHDALGVNTATVPDAAVLWAPRAAFNWQSGRALRTQLRGGAGVFTGTPAYAWLANAFSQTGTTTALLTCGTGRTPLLEPAAAAASCQGSAVPGDVRSAAVTVFSRDFRFPQDVRVALGIDQALPRGVVATADVVYARARRQIFLRDINRGAAATDPSHEAGYTDGFGFHRRHAYGTPSPGRFAPNRRDPAFGHVIELGEQAENRALAASFELAGLVRGVAMRSAYTYTRSIDVQSLTHRDAAASFGGNPTTADPNEPYATRSDFDRPHKVLLSLSAAALERRTGTQLSLFYSAESGTPFTYVYDADINGDGFPGAGTTDIHNDPIAVPALISGFPGALMSAVRFMELIDREPCLRRARGSMLLRNDCRGPATHRLDLRAAQAIRGRGLEIRVVGDMLNVLHLLGSDRGLVRRVDPRTPLLGVTTRELPADELFAFYGGAVVQAADGSLRVLSPHTIDPTASRWQAQLGVEVKRLRPR